MADFRVTWLGHGTVLLDLDGQRVLTDPLLTTRLGLIRRVADPLPPDVLADVDVVLISHLHRDHLHVPSLRTLVRYQPRIIVPAGAAGFVLPLGFEDVVELPPGGFAWAGPLGVTATPAEHDGRRQPAGAWAPPIGFVVEGSRRVYVAGDTDLFPAMADLGPLDHALLPVWGWGPRLGPGHLDPVRAAEAVRLIAPRRATPIHWGTYWPMGMHRVATSRILEPATEFRDAARIQAPGVEVTLLQPGESTLDD
jgi:L-ascorbate metabolism protein UlaG (beta-lactamase superfamily)